MSFPRASSFFFASVVLLATLVPVQASAAWTYQYNCGRGALCNEQSPAYPTQATCETARTAQTTGAPRACTGTDDVTIDPGGVSTRTWTFPTRGGGQSGGFATQAVCEAASQGAVCTQNGAPVSGDGREGAGAPGTPLPVSSGAVIDYSPLVNLPFVGGGVQTIGGYLVSIFRLLIGLAGIMAVVRMVICGFQAIISLNPSARGEASSCVLGAITGLLLALSAWLLLYQINPTILGTDFVPPSTGTVVNTGGSGGGPSGGGGGSGGSGGGGNGGGGGGGQPPAQCDARNLCQGEATGPACSAANPACAPYASFANLYVGGGISANLIREIMAQESSCNPSAGNGVAYGLMQLRPATANQNRAACGIPSTTSTTPAWLQNPANARLSVCLAAAELRALRSGACGNSDRQVVAGYNGGAGACQASQDCTQNGCTGQPMRQWECPFEDAAQQTCNTGFDETRTHVRRVLECL